MIRPLWIHPNFPEVFFGILQDTAHKDRVFHLRERLTLIVNITIDGVVDGMHAMGHFRLRIAGRYADYTSWDAERWSEELDAAARRDEFCQIYGYGVPSANVMVTVSDGDEALLLMSIAAGQRVPIVIDIDHIKEAIRRKIMSVPYSRASDPCRQSALSDDGELEVKCRQRMLP